MTFIRCVEWIWDRLVAFVAAMVTAFAAFLARLRWIPVAAMLTFVPILQSAHAQTIADDSVWLVDGVNGNDSDSGQDQWSNALLTIDEAFSRAVAGEQIWVRATTYTLSSTTDTVLLDDGVWLLGGFDTSDDDRTDADPYANPTILDGDNTAYHVVTADNPLIVDQQHLTRLDGFIITGGDASDDSISPDGGGLLVLGNAASDQIALTVTRCRFESNNAINGGAVAVHRNGGESFTELAVQLINCEFMDNTAGDGGAVWVSGGYAEIVNSLFVGNTATNNGGGLHLQQVCAKDPISHCITFGCVNFQHTKGLVRSSTFSQNVAGGEGGGAYAERGIDELRFVSSILWGNSDSSSTTLEREQIAQNIYCGVNDALHVLTTYSCIEDLDYYAAGGTTENIGDDPEFVDDTNGDFRLQTDSPRSPCIDTGDIDGLFPKDLLDFDNDGITTGEFAPDLQPSHGHRIVGTAIDMGAYEVHFEISTCAADCVDTDTFQPPPDGTINAADLSVLLGAYGDCPPPCCMDTVDTQSFAPPPDGVVELPI